MRYLTIALLVVTGFRVMLFGLFGVIQLHTLDDIGFVEVIDALTWLATGFLLTGGQMYLMHAHTSFRTRRDVEWDGEGRAIHALILAAWAMLATGAVLMAGSHVAMQMSGRPLFGTAVELGVLELEFIRANWPLWVAALLSQLWIEVLASALGASEATRTALGVPAEVSRAEARALKAEKEKDAMRLERNAKSDEAYRLQTEVERLREVLESALVTSVVNSGTTSRSRDVATAESLATSGSSSAPEKVTVTCPVPDCDWSAVLSPAQRARSFSMHWSRKHPDLDRAAFNGGAS